VGYFFVIAAPLFISLLASRFIIFFGLLTALSIVVSLLLQNARFRLEHGDSQFWTRFWETDLKSWFLITIVACLLSLFVSIPIYFLKRRLTAAHGRKIIDQPTTVAYR
jgi:ABC-type Fe3+ transport system permease subunit